MKMNRIKQISATIAVLCFMTGCSAEVATVAAEVQEEVKSDMTDISVNDYIELANRYLESADDFRGELQIEMQMGSEDEVIFVGAKIAMIREPLSVSIETQNHHDGVVRMFNTYLEEEADSVEMYMNYEGSWSQLTLQKSTVNNHVDFYDIQNNMYLLLNTAQNLTVEAINDHEMVLRGEIAPQDVHYVSEKGHFLQMAGMTGIDAVYYEGVPAVEVTFVLDRESGAPLRMRIDFTDALEVVINNVLRTLNGEVEGEKFKVQRYIIDGGMDSLNTVVRVEIPEEGRSDAINYEEEIAYMVVNESGSAGKEMEQGDSEQHVDASDSDLPNDAL